MNRKISEYGVIGNMVSAALISADGSLEWLCLPRFDGPACFLKILDDKKGGYCAVRVKGMKEHSRRYVPRTNILETKLMASSGILEITDFMPVSEAAKPGEKGNDAQGDPLVMRLLTCTRGQIDGFVETFPTPNFAQEHAKITGKDKHWVAAGAHTSVHLQLSHGGHARGNKLQMRLRLKAGEKAFVIISDSSMHRPKGATIEHVEHRLEITRKYWEDWSATCDYDGGYSDLVLRSALALKLMVFESSGAIIAAPTTSLPEWIGGERNWDYRYSWLRDSSLTLVALMNLGYVEEAHDFFKYLRKILPHDPDDYQIMYGVGGETNLQERNLKNLKGYRKSRPVRLGNGAAHQTQLDIFGELAHCIYLYWNHPGFGHQQESFEDLDWRIISSAANYVSKNWRKPGSGIWEMRGPEKQHTHSKAMCCLALDRAIKLAEQFHLRSPEIPGWKRARREAYDEFSTKGYNRKLPGFVQTYGSKATDAALLRLPLFGVLDPSDPRVSSTIALVERQLLKNGLVYRYRVNDDGSHGDEGTFNACSFWLIENYVLQGRWQEAKEMFDSVVSGANDLGLMSEEMNPRNFELLGNFPQGFTHIAMINAAVRIDQADRGDKSEPHELLEGKMHERGKRAA